MMKRRMIAMLLVVLMMGQMLPISAQAEDWQMVVSNEAQGAQYHQVTFQYPMYTVDENGEETISGYSTIVEQLVKDGEAPVEPNIPDLTGRRFTGWTKNGALAQLGPVTEDSVFQATYSKLDMFTVTINYEFAIDHSMALEPYVAEFTAGSEVDIKVPSPALSGFEVPAGEKIVEIHIPSITENVEYTVEYTGAKTFYTVKYHFQNVADNGYTADSFYREAIHGHAVDDALGNGETGEIKVGPYKIEVYPDGTPQAGKPVIAGGMTAVRNFEIEGFVQREIEQQRVMPDGKTVVNVYYDRELHTYTVDNAGGTAVDSRTLRYGSSLNLPDPSKMERPGYTFKGFFSKNYKYQDNQWVVVDGEQEHNSSCKMPPYDFTIEVRWEPVKTAEYKVVYWVQSVKDAYNTPSENKTYDFLRAETLEGDVGVRPTVYKLGPAQNGLNSTFFDRNSQRTETGAVQGSDWRGYYATATKAIAPDGSTVINVYFDRKTVTYNFYNTANSGWLNDSTRYMTLKGLYGQSFAEASAATGTEIKWPAPPKGQWPGTNYMWRGQGVWDGGMTYLNGFYASNLDRTTVNLYKLEGGNAVVQQYSEELDGTWTLVDEFKASVSTLVILDKMAPGYSVTHCDRDRNNAVGPTTAVKVGDTVQGNHIEVYNSRNSFELAFANCAEGSMPAQHYKYEEVLLKPDAVPQRPDNVEYDHEFAGWYLDAAGQVPVDWGTQTMPAANLVVYAKWVPPTFTVTYTDIRKDTEGSQPEIRYHEFKVEKFGTVVSQLDDLNREYVINSTKYTDSDDKLTYTFIGWFVDEEGTVRWNPQTPITANRRVYAKWEPSGTVWYRYRFIGLGEDSSITELGKWPEKPIEETVWPSRLYGEYADAAKDFSNAGMTGFPPYEGWRPVSTLSTTMARLTDQYQEIPVYYVRTSSWPLTIHYVDEKDNELRNEETHELTEYAKVYSYKRIDKYKLISEPQIRVTKDDAKGPDGRVHIYFRYKELRHLPYRVEYYQENLDGGYDLLPNETKIYTEENSRWDLGETAEPQFDDNKIFTGFTRNDKHKDAVTKVILRENQENVLKLYYDRNSYKVSYIYGDQPVPTGAPELPAAESYKYGETVTVADTPEFKGYVFHGWYTEETGIPTSGDFPMPARDIVFRGNWGARDDTPYLVQFFLQNEDGTYSEDQSTYERMRRGKTDEIVSVRPDDKHDRKTNGLVYRFKDGYHGNVLEGKLTADADNMLVLKLYFDRVMTKYTVHHYLEGTDHKVADDEILDAQVGASVLGRRAGKFIQGYEKAIATSAVPTDARITVQEQSDKNVITIYYEMPLTLKASDASKTYDGTPLKNGDFTVEDPTALVNGDKAEDITLSMTGDSSITDPGTRANKIDSGTIRINGQPLPVYYRLSLENGTLTVVQRLNVSKTITKPSEVLPGETGTALDVPQFSFTLKKDGTAVSGAAYTVGGQEATTDENGVFKLNAGETASFKALGQGNYSVVENYFPGWAPEGVGSYEKTANLGTSGAGDVRVAFINRRTSAATQTLTKVWMDGNGTAAKRPETLDLTLIGTAADKEVYRASVTLEASKGWTMKVDGLPSMANGESIKYSLVEEKVPAGYTASMSGLTVTNTVAQKERSITGTKTWVDGAREHDNTKDITLTLERRTNGGNWLPYTSPNTKLEWVENTYTFSGLPSYDQGGYAYEYRVVEKVNVQGLSYDEPAYTDANGQPNQGIAKFNEAGLGIVNLTNTIKDGNNRYLYGDKTWVDGGKPHKNAAELTISLERRSSKLGSPWEQNFKDEGGYSFGWSEKTPNRYGFNGLERYDSEGYAYEYRVVETINNEEDAKLYETTYSPENGVSANDRQVDIINTLKDENDVTVSGTKTWVDGGKSHDNAAELTLTLTRTSADPDAKAEEVKASPTWQGNTYTFSDLERYDDKGYEYTYSVKEAAVEGYTSAQDQYDFINTLKDENDVTVSGTKTWVDGGKSHDNAAELTLTLTRTSADPDAKAEEVKASPTWQGNTYTFSDLERYDDKGYEYTYSVKEAAVEGYTSAQDQYNFTNTLTDDNDVSVSGTKTWVDGGKSHDNAAELTLTLFRTSADPDAKEKEVTASPTWNGNTYRFEHLERYDDEGYAYEYRVVETINDKDQATLYETTYSTLDGVFPADGRQVHIINTLKLVGGHGRLTVSKTWDDKNGDPNDRPEVSFQLLNSDGTPVKKEGKDWIVSLDTGTNTAVFVDVPLSVDGYIVKELIDSSTNTYGYKADKDTVVVAANGTTAAFTNTRTKATVTVTKQIVDQTTDSAAGLAQRFIFELNGKRSEPIGDGDSASFLVELGGKYRLTELDESGTELPKGVWSTTGLGEFLVHNVDLKVDVTNTRNMYGDQGGNVTVTKAWLDGNGNALDEALIPESIAVKLYEGTNAKYEAELDRDNGWKNTWSGLPAYSVDGTKLVYSVKETVNGTDHGNGDTVTIGGKSYGVSINGFAISNSLKNSEPTKPEKTADQESQKGVQVGDEVSYTIRRTSHLATKAKATVTDVLPAGLDFVRTDSVKVNGVERAIQAELSGNTVSWMIEDLPPMGTIEVVFTARVTEKAVKQIENKASVDLGDKSDSQFESESEKIPVAKFSLSKSAKLPAGKDKAGLGDSIDYTIVLTNTGEVKLTAATIKDLMFDRAKGDVLVNGAAVKPEQQAISLSGVEPGKSISITYSVDVTEDDILNGSVDNIAVANASFGEGKALPEQEAKTSTATEAKHGHLRVEKRTVSQPKDKKGYTLNETISYEIVVKNDGNLVITDIKVIDSLSSAKDKVIGTIDSLKPGESKVFSFEYKVTQEDVRKGTVINEATAVGKKPDPDAPDVPVDPGKTEDKTVDQPKPGDNKQYFGKGKKTYGFGAGYASVSVYDCCE